MSDFKPGEIVDITIKGAQVDEVGRNGLHVVMPNGTTAHIELSNYEGITIERVAPAEWPPRPGDLWRDQHGAVWFAADLVDDGGDPAIYMLASREDRQVAPDYCNETYGPLTLVHREDEQDGGRSDG